MTRTPKSEKAPRRTAILSALFMAALLYLGGAITVADFAWVVDPDAWWMWLVVLPISGAIYYQARNNLL